MVRSRLHVSVPISSRCFALVLGLLLGGPLSAVSLARQAPAVTGVVVDPSGAAITGARVSLRDAAAGVTIAAVSTDASGSFTFPRPAAGRFEVEVTAALFDPVRQAITLS